MMMKKRWVVVLAGFVGLVVATVFPSLPTKAMGRWGMGAMIRRNKPTMAGIT